MKRRKSTRSDASSPQEKVAKTSKEKNIAVVEPNDECEAEKSDAATDVKSYKMACEEIRNLIKEINDLKSEGKNSNVSVQRLANMKGKKKCKKCATY